MNNEQRDGLLVSIHQDVGEVKGFLKSFSDSTGTRLDSLEKGKVGWRTFSAVSGIMATGFIGAIKWLGGYGE